MVFCAAEALFAPKKLLRNRSIKAVKRTLELLSGVLKNDGALASENDGKTQGSATRINLMGFFKAWAGGLNNITSNPSRSSGSISVHQLAHYP